MDKKRPQIAIGGKPATPEEVRAAAGEASTAWLREHRPAKPPRPKRKHRARTQAEKEAKALETATAKKRRAEERDARERDRVQARVNYLLRRSEREAAAMLRVRAGWKRRDEPKVSAACPRALFNRMHDEVMARVVEANRPSRVASDGYKNIVLHKTMRGLGKKSPRTRAYRFGEAADLARYILREEALETGVDNQFTNLFDFEGGHAVEAAGDFSLEDRRMAQIVAFWNALEAFEAEVDDAGNIFSHVILALPRELSPAGRSSAIEDICLTLDGLCLPFVAGLHAPDPDGSQDNYHAHLIFAARPFHIAGPFAWEFESAKATELNLPAGLRWLRREAARAFNEALAREGKFPAVKYSGVSQAERGVPAIGATHDGPAKTRRKRQAERDLEEGARLARELARHVARAIERHAELDTDLARLASMPAPSIVPERTAVELPEPPVPATDAPIVVPHAPLPLALAALREKYPDPLRLKGLSALAFEEFTAADWAADRWYSPAFDLAVSLSRSVRLVRDNQGEPEIMADQLDARYLPLLEGGKLPDIVMKQLHAAHRRLLDQQAYEAKRRRERERLRKEALAWLRGEPVVLFQPNGRVFDEHRDRFPSYVMELDGVRDAMIACHVTAVKMREQARRRAIEARAPQKPSQVSPAEAASPPPAGAAPIVSSTRPQQPAQQNVVQQQNEDEEIDPLVLAAAAQLGIGKIRGGSGGIGGS